MFEDDPSQIENFPHKEDEDHSQVTPKRSKQKRAEEHQNLLTQSIENIIAQVDNGDSAETTQINFSDGSPRLNKTSKPQTEDSDLPHEHWGEGKSQIENLNRKFFSTKREKLEGRTLFAHGAVVIENFDWQKKHRKIGSMFTDTSFPPEESSMLGQATLMVKDQERLMRMRMLEFRRVSSIRSDARVIDVCVSPHDVKQGNLANSYFMSSLASIAVYPARIERNILQKTVSERGAYCVALCITGCWVSIIIDDFMPVRNILKKSKVALAFGQIHSNAFWPILLEKAHAKVYGAYWNIGHGMHPTEALRDLTGVPTERVDFKDINLERLMQALDNQFVVVLSSVASPDKKKTTVDNGLVTNHSYSLLGTVELSNGVRLFKLRNSWDQGLWQGDWSDKSSLWTKKYKKEAGFTQEDEGTVFINFQDLKLNFEGMSIAHYHDDYYYSYLPASNLKTEFDRLQITVHETGEYYIGLSQPSKFLHGPTPGYQYSYLSCVIHRREGSSKYVHVGEFAGNSRDPWSKFTLTRGTYMAAISTDWRTDATDYTFWTYGANNTVIKKINSWSNHIFQILNPTFTELALAHQEGWKIESKAPGTGYCRSKQVELKGFMYYVFHNQYKNRVWNICLRDYSSNYELIGPRKGEKMIQLTVDSGSTEILVFRALDVQCQALFNLAFTLEKPLLEQK